MKTEDTDTKEERTEITHTHKASGWWIAGVAAAIAAVMIAADASDAWRAHEQELTKRALIEKGLWTPEAKEAK